MKFRKSAENNAPKSGQLTFRNPRPWCGPALTGGRRHPRPRRNPRSLLDKGGGHHRGVGACLSRNTRSGTVFGDLTVCSFVQSDFTSYCWVGIVQSFRIFLCNPSFRYILRDPPTMAHMYTHLLFLLVDKHLLRSHPLTTPAGAGARGGDSKPADGVTDPRCSDSAGCSRVPQR